MAALAGFDIDGAGYRQSHVKGSYFRVRGRVVARPPSGHPVPPTGLAGLGVHVTLELNGTVWLDLDSRAHTRDYRVDETKANALAKGASRFLEGLTSADLSPDQPGIRPKLRAAAGAMPDFILREESTAGRPGWGNLLGIEPPRLTRSLEIARRVASLL